MKRMLFIVLLVMTALAGSHQAFAQGEEPTIYVIKKGDTLWGLSDRFIKDPYYWPNLWANNPIITNPHLIFPGEKVRIYPDRIVLEGAPPPAAREVKPEVPQPPAKAVEEMTPERTFLVRGGTGFILEKDVRPVGYIIATHQNRQLMGEDDIVYTDIGKVQKAKVGDRFRSEFTGFMPYEKEAGPDGIVGTVDDVFSPGTLVDLDAFVDAKKSEILTAVQADYAPVDNGHNAFQVVGGATGDITIRWEDSFGLAGTATTAGVDGRGRPLYPEGALALAAAAE